MSDARISTALPAHPKTKKLVRRLGLAAGWHLVCLFLWAAQNRSDGDLTGMSDEDIELAVDWAGDDGAFVAALAAVGFLDGEESAYRIHDWAEHNPWAAGSEARSQKSKWAALCKQYGRQQAATMMPEYAASIGRASSGDAGGEPAACDGQNLAVPEGASGTPLAETGSAPSPLPSPSPTSRAKASLRSASSPAKPEDASGQLPGIAPPADPPKPPTLAERVAQITDEATAAYNASELVKPNGGLLATVRVRVGREKRQAYVKRCLRTARAICLETYGSERISPRFWQDYWAACFADEFHSGRKGGGRGHEDWIPDFEFLTREDVMLKVFERAVGEDAA